jgi:hypothetical protein
LRRFVRTLPGFGPALIRLRRRQSFEGSAAYWERRYVGGGTSGSGSYGNLADFKAHIVNALIAQLDIESVIEFGCGDGNQLSKAEYPLYIGLDVSRTAIELCASRFAGDPTKCFFIYDPHSYGDNAPLFRCQLALSMDVIFHLVEDEVFELYMEHLFDSSARYVLIYSSNFEGETGSNHMRNRAFGSWVDRNRPTWALASVIPNQFPYHGDSESGSVSDFHLYEKSGTRAD